MRNNLIHTRRIIAWPSIVNGLTILRIIIGLPVVLTLTYKIYDIFILLIIIGGITDFLDGYFARKFNCQTTLGAKLDPLADKILILGPMIWLVHESLVPLWSIWIILSRELIITSWRSNNPTGAPASMQGKYKTILQFISIILLFWPQNWGTESLISLIHQIGYISFWVSLFLTITSGISYVFTEIVFHQN